jgi:mono/diheme cytochrome c family protein
MAVLVAAVMIAEVSAQTPVERGRYLVEVLGACGNCHTPKAPDGGDIRIQQMAGGLRIEEFFGVAIAPNITPDRETGIGSWSDAEIIRAIREGKGKDGRTLGPPMAFDQYRRLSDGDVKAMVAYLRALPPVRNMVPRSQYRFPLPASYGPPVGSVPDPPRHDPITYGEYLAGPVAHCADCHTPRTDRGQPDPARFFAGGLPFTGPWGKSFSSNITPDPATGIGSWTDAQIIAALYGARRDGQRILPPMPASYYAAGIAADDLRAIIAYLRSLRPVANRVPPPVPPKRP